MATSPQENPFQTPAARLQETPAIAEAPLYRLAAVGIAAFFGTPLAGAWVMVQNLKRLGRYDQVRTAWFAGIGAFAAISLLAWFLPENVIFTPINLAAAAGMQQYAKQQIGTDMEQHRANGGAIASNWRAFGVSLLFLLALATAVFVVSFAIALIERT